MRNRILVRSLGRPGLGLTAGAVLGVMLLASLAACGSGADARTGAEGQADADRPVLPFSYAGPVVELPQLAPGQAEAHESEVDWAIARDVVDWAQRQRLDLLPVGEVVAIVASTFVGATYTPGTLELPGPEGLVVNLREFDCVTFVEHMLVLGRLIVSGADPLDEAAFQEGYRAELTALRYRGGVLDGYPSRLHYFSEWIRDAERKGFLEDVTEGLGGVQDPRPITFMSRHPDAYRQLLENADLLAVIRETEARISAEARYMIPEGEVARVADQIQNGDIIAAVSSLEGLDVAHTGIALWHDGRLHLLHAPLVGESVEISARPLAERILGIGSQSGIMVARPLEPSQRSGGN